MTFRGIINDKWQLIPVAIYMLYNFAVYKCDQESVNVTMYLLFSVFHKLVYSINLTSQLLSICLAKS